MQTISIRKGFPISFALAELPGTKCKAGLHDAEG